MTLRFNSHVVVKVVAYTLDNKVMFKTEIAVPQGYRAIGLAKSYVRAYIKNYPNPEMRASFGRVEGEYKMKEGKRIELTVIPDNFDAAEYGVL